MTNKQKYARISEQIMCINTEILKNFPHKITFETHGSGEYCIILAKKVYQFATLGDVITFLTFILDLFSIALSK